ncbi:TetR/AcrR family transcriptional regulator [Psychromonas sp.]|uniref:TetR/AcrR family transcriptional regulator n=1 Tax=Psychromonas sp. TaxID=1884585 RepID=UPI0039E53521
MIGEQKELILSAALQLLKELGCEGFSLAKVADRANIPQSTVLLHFKNKSVLLDILFSDFIDAYFVHLRNYQAPEGLIAEKALGALLLHMLKYRESTLCVQLFKEFWVFSNHNKMGYLALDQYYRELHAVIVKHLTSIAPVDCAEQKIQFSASVLLPFVEGYSITRTTLPISILQLVDQLSIVLKRILYQPV